MAETKPLESRTPDAFLEAWTEYCQGGHGPSFGWEKVAFTRGFGAGWQAAERETLERAAQLLDNEVSCECGEDDEAWKRKKAGKMYNTECGHAINCPKYLVWMVRDLGKG